MELITSWSILVLFCSEAVVLSLSDNCNLGARMQCIDAVYDFIPPDNDAQTTNLLFTFVGEIVRAKITSCQNKRLSFPIPFCMRYVAVLGASDREIGYIMKNRISYQVS